MTLVVDSVQPPDQVTPIAPMRPRGSMRSWTAASRALSLAVTTLLVLLLWRFGADAYGNRILFPGPGETFTTLWEQLKSGDLEPAIAASLRRILIGFLIGSTGGILLGLLAGNSRVILGLTEPFVNLFRFIPPLAWFGPVMLIFGIGETAEIVLIVYTTIFVVTLNTIAGVQAVPRNMTRMAAVFGASRARTFVAVSLPASVPYILVGTRIALGNAFMTVVTAEMLSADKGLGVNITNGMTTLDVKSVLSSIIVLGVLGYSSDISFSVLIRRAQNRYGGRARSSR